MRKDKLTQVIADNFAHQSRSHDPLLSQNIFEIELEF